jgi:hypothetical protein
MMGAFARQPQEVLMLAYLFVLLAIAVRVLPHPWTFTPVVGALLFFGARGSRKQMWVPLLMFAATDVLLTKVLYAAYFSWDHYVTWLWYAAILWLGSQLRSNATPLRVIASALASSVSFFLLSNLAAWAAYTDTYPRTLNGVMMSYVAGLPFFRHATEGDLLFTCAMFATPVFLKYVGTLLRKPAANRIAA